MSIITPPGHILLILRRLKENGHAAYLVGGCVRDAVMERPMRDWDIATSAAPLDIARLFRDAVMIGAKFGTVKVVIPRFAEGSAVQRQTPSNHNGAIIRNRRRDDITNFGSGKSEHGVMDEVQVTTFRTESEYLDGRHPAVVEFVSTLDEDLSRRDFTINAMAYSINGRLIDLFGGLDDISNRIIRCVGDPNTRFSDDALRMFRAYRFRAELGFDIDKDTLCAIHERIDKAINISSERISDELGKILMSQNPDVICEVIKCGLLGKYLSPEPGAHIPDLVDEACGTIKNIAKLPEESMLRWCVFCSVCIETKIIATAAQFLRKLNIDEKTVKICSLALSIRMFPEKRSAVKRLLAKHGTDIVRCAAAIHDVHIGAEHNAAIDSVAEIINSGECFCLHDLAVSGRDLIQLGYTPGPQIGKFLDKLLKHVIDHPDENKRELLLEML